MSDPAHAHAAERLARSLAAADGDETQLMQSSFYLDEGWDDGARPRELTRETIQRAIQLLIDRGVVPDSTGARDDDANALLIVCLDDTLSLAGGRKPYHARFASRLGQPCVYGVAKFGVAAELDRDDRLVTQAQALLEAISREPAGEVPVEINATDDRRLPDDIRDNSEWNPPLPSIYVSERVPRFRFEPKEMERYVVSLGLPDTLGTAVLLRQATSVLEGRVTERATRPSPATEAELHDFSAPNPRITMAERLQALAYTIGEDHPDLAIVKEILKGISEPAFARLRRRFYNDGGYVFIDTVYWIYHKLRLAQMLGLDKAEPQSILDIGCGGGHFSRVCQHFGHRVLGTDIEQPAYAAVATALGVERTIDTLLADTPTPDYGRKFNMVTAVQVEFNRLFPRTNPPRYWNVDHWRYLFNDLIERQLEFPARIYIYLNFEIHNGKGVFNQDLLKLCTDLGADVNARRGIIDWKLESPITV